MCDHGGLVREDTLQTQVKALAPNEKELDDSNIHLAFTLHEDLDCIGNTIDFSPHVKEKELSSFSIKHLSGQVVNKLNKHGDVKSVTQLEKDLTEVLSNVGFDSQKTKSLITIDKRLTLLDDDMVGLIEWRHINPRTLRDKILFVLRNNKKPMHFTGITETISGLNFDNRSVNLQAVHNELIRHDHFVLIGRGIYALTEWGYEKGTVADVIEAILGKHKELGQDEIIDKVLGKRQVKQITIVLALKNGKKFERVGRKRYKLKK